MLRALVEGALAHIFGVAPRPQRLRRRAREDELQLSLALAPVAEPGPPAQPLRRPEVVPPRPAPATADELLRNLRALGLREGAAAGGIDRCRLTRNRTVMVSFRRGELRVHRGYLPAPDDVLRAIVAFVHARTRGQRRAAQRVILAYPVPEDERRPRAADGPPRRARERTRPEDEHMVRVLAEWHRRYNDRHFGSALTAVPIRVSRRLRSRLGHYTAAGRGEPAEIVIGRSHIRRHGWEEALHTLLHEMVHQWQDESGLAVDHGAAFRRKAREVGIAASARREVGRRRDSAA